MSYRKMNGILLPGNSLKFPLVKVIVSKIAYKSLKTTKNSHFLRTDHRNVVHENFFRDFGDIICIKNLFRPIRVINRTNSWAILTRIGEDIDHFSKWPANPPTKKKFPLMLTECWSIIWRCVDLWLSNDSWDIDCTQCVSVTVVLYTQRISLFVQENVYFFWKTQKKNAFFSKNDFFDFSKIDT